MHYEFIAIPDADVPQAVEPVFQHIVTTYASEANTTVSVWRAVPGAAAAMVESCPGGPLRPSRSIAICERTFGSACSRSSPRPKVATGPGSRPSKSRS